MQTEPRILIVDDDPLNVEIIVEFLDTMPYLIETAENGEQAWDRLQQDTQLYDVVVLDRMMPKLDGMEVLRRIKQHDELKAIPVIMQTALASRDEILEGLSAGAYYYLTKPFDESLLRTVLATAVEDRMRYRQVQADLAASGRTLALLVDGCFKFRTLIEARDLASMLANACPNPSKVVVGLSEILINAVEHGNLGLGYEDKSRLRSEHGAWEAEIERRLADDLWGKKAVQVHLTRNQDQLTIRVTDEGDGFDWMKYLAIDPARIFDTHGRGIAVSKMLSFDSVEYLGKGNEVLLTVKL